MICPKCNSNYRDGFTKCSDCGLDLVEKTENNVQELPKNILIYKYSAFSIVSLLVFFCLFHFVFYGMGSLVLFFIASILILILTIIGIVQMLRKKKHIVLFIAITLIPIILLSFFINTKVRSYENNLTEERAQEIIDALDDYHTEYFSYPETIDALVPKYLNSVPSTCISQGNKGYEYYRTFDGAYILQYYSWNTPMVYDKTDNNWQPRPKG